MAEEKSGATSGSSVLENIAVVLLQNKLSVIIVVTLFVCLFVCQRLMEAIGLLALRRDPNLKCTTI